MQTADIDWNTLYRKERDYAWVSTVKLSHILRQCNTAPNVRVLDIGCGTGQLCRDLVHRGCQVLGIDTASEAIGIAKAPTILPKEVIEFTVGSIEQ